MTSLEKTNNDTTTTTNTSTDVNTNLISSPSSNYSSIIHNPQNDTVNMHNKMIHHVSIDNGSNTHQDDHDDGDDDDVSYQESHLILHHDDISEASSKSRSTIAYYQKNIKISTSTTSSNGGHNDLILSGETQYEKMNQKDDDDDDDGDDDDAFDECEKQDMITTPPLHHKGTIGMLGSVAIAVNSLTGPAMIDLPYLYQTAGFIPTTVTLAFICVLSTLCALHLANVISKVPGNRNFHKEIEYSETFRHFWGRKAFVFSHITFYCCITCLNIASIVDTAQVVDQMLSKQLKGGAIALSLSRETEGASLVNYDMDTVVDTDYHMDTNTNPLMGKQHFINDTTAATSKSVMNWSLVRWNRSTCYLDDDDDDIVTGGNIGGGVGSGDSSDLDDVDYDNCVPFQSDSSNHTSWLVTLGYLLAAICFLPMSLQDLKENTIFQIVGFIVLLVLSAQFIYTFIQNGIDMNNISMWGDNYEDLFGVCLFNFAVVVAIPAWLYEKKPSVSVTTALNGSSLIAFILYVVVGSLGAMTMKNVNNNMLQTMMSGAFGEVTEVASMSFAFFIIGLGIPLFSVLVRLNLTGSGLCSTFTANILAVYVPWGVSWLFYSGGATGLLGWGGIIFTSIIAFLAPLGLALHAESEFDVDGSIKIYGNLELTKRQKIITLYALLMFSIASIVLAVIGQLT